MNRQTITVRGAKLDIIERVRHDYSYRGWKEFTAAPRLYVSAKDETFLENLENRKRRPYNVYKSLIRSSALSSVLDLGRLSWSQHAGCTMCPCSPGFILNRQSLNLGGSTILNWDAWLTLEEAPSVDPSKAPRALVLL